MAHLTTIYGYLHTFRLFPLALVRTCGTVEVHRCAHVWLVGVRGCGGGRAARAPRIKSLYE